MTAKEIQKRNQKAENLRVLQTDEDQFYVESEKGKILYSVTFTDEQMSCTCGDYNKSIKRDPDAKCKHILAVMNRIPNGQVGTACFLKKQKPRLDERWIIEIDKNQFVKYAGLLDYAHQIGISSIEVEPLQLPTKENGNSAICKATAVSKLGESFTDIGDANPANCNAKVAKHLLRLASTRAIARALRSMTNVGLTAIEELEDLNDVIGKGEPKAQPKGPRKVARKAKELAAKLKPEPKTEPKDSKAEAEEPSPAKEKGFPDKPSMSEAQKRAIYNLSRRRGISVEDLEARAMETYGCELENLSTADASSFIRNLQQAA
jgi:hypothetical protein